MVAVEVTQPITRRGSRRRAAILSALRGLLDESSFQDISVADITKRARITRPNFYFYFESKFAVLAALQQERTIVAARTARRTHRRQPGESETHLVGRIIDVISSLLADNDPVWTTCRTVRHLDAAIQAAVSNAENTVIATVIDIIAAEVGRSARPISPDLPVLIRTLTVATAASAYGDSRFVGRDGDSARSLAAIKAIWVHAVWPHHAVSPSTRTLAV